MRQRVFKSIPNIFTLGNLYCGFFSIGFASGGAYNNSAIFILIGMMLDGMDGRLARMLEVDSILGKELDSLADIVTFGVAPSFLLYYTYFYQFDLLGFVIAGLFPLFGAYRLARFNTISSEVSLNYFIGIPITAAGGILAIITLFREYIPNTITMMIFIVLSFLMISTTKFPSLKQMSLPKCGTFAILFMGIALYVIYRGTNAEFPYFIYFAVPLYIIYLGYRYKKEKNKRSMGRQF